MEPEFVSCGRGEEGFFIKQEEEMLPEDEDLNSENIDDANVATSVRENEVLIKQEICDPLYVMETEENHHSMFSVFKTDVSFHFDSEGKGPIIKQEIIEGEESVKAEPVNFESEPIQDGPSYVSEEDEVIDVVSLREISSSSRSSSCSSGLPTRPTQQEQRHLDATEDEEVIDVVSLREISSSSRSSSCSSGLPIRPMQREQRHLHGIITSLLSAREAVSRKIRQTKFKRKKYHSESSEDDDDYQDESEDEEEIYYQKYDHHTKWQKPSSMQSVRRKRSKTRTGSFSGVEEDDQEKRDEHNSMERLRRVDMRNSFEELKTLVPAISSKIKAAKVLILKEAAFYCQELQAEGQSKCMQVMALRKEQERLREIVSSLR